MVSLRENTVLQIHRIFSHQPLLETADDNAFAKMLRLTVCRHGISLAKIINNYLAKKIPNKHALAQTVLITAAAELLFMDSPIYAVINSYVDITKHRCGKSLSGLVNAVLHNLSKNKKVILAEYHQQFFPDSFREILKSDYSPQTIDQIEKAAGNEPPLNITVKKDPQQWAEKLGGKLISGHTLTLTQPGKIENLPGYTEGQWWVQDFAASLAVRQFSALSGKRILDLCAAPGGKTAQLLVAGAHVTSLDCSETRLDTLRHNLQRLNLKPEKIICADALDYLQNFNEQPFDGILLDAPCSATGIFRRHPEIVFTKTQDDVNKQAILQKKLLQNLTSALKIGGELIYCTCSITHAEGELQILDFVKNYPNFKIIPLSEENDFIRTLPFQYAETGGCDAFFVAKLIRKA